MGFIIARMIAAILLFWALDRHPYGYYTLLRFAVCGVSIYGMYVSSKLEKTGWVWTFGIIAILFNPLIPIHLRRDIWQFIDLAVGVLLLISIFMLRKSSMGQVEEHPPRPQNISYEVPSTPKKTEGYVDSAPKKTEGSGGSIDRKVICSYCKGYGEFIDKRRGRKNGTVCTHCSGTGWITEE